MQALELNLFQDRLRLVRTSQGFTQEEMAKKLNVSFSTYKSYERGTSKMTLDKAELLAIENDISLDFLVLGKTADRDKTMQEISDVSLPKNCTT